MVKLLFEIQTDCFYRKLMTGSKSHRHNYEFATENEQSKDWNTGLPWPSLAYIPKWVEVGSHA